MTLVAAGGDQSHFTKLAYPRGSPGSAPDGLVFIEIGETAQLVDIRRQAFPIVRVFGDVEIINRWISDGHPGLL